MGKYKFVLNVPQVIDGNVWLIDWIKNDDWAYAGLRLNGVPFGIDLGTTQYVLRFKVTSKYIDDQTVELQIEKFWNG